MKTVQIKKIIYDNFYNPYIAIILESETHKIQNIPFQNLIEQLKNREIQLSNIQTIQDMETKQIKFIISPKELLKMQFSIEPLTLDQWIKHYKVIDINFSLELNHYGEKVKYINYIIIQHIVTKTTHRLNDKQLFKLKIIDERLTKDQDSFNKFMEYSDLRFDRALNCYKYIGYTFEINNENIIKNTLKTQKILFFCEK